MKTKVICAYRARFPRNIGKMAERILRAVPEQYTLGLDSIILVDRIRRSKSRDAVGIYVRKSASELPHVEIAVETLYEDMPGLVFFLPLVARLLLSEVMFHEVGHHYQTLIRTPKKSAIEKHAEDFSTMMMRRAFPGWRFVLRSLSRLISPLRRSFSNTVIGADTVDIAFGKEKANYEQTQNLESDDNETE